jgi:hypothetical protein
MSVFTIRRLLCTRTHQRHEGVLIVFFASTRLAGGLLLGASRRHTHASAVCHICRLVLLCSSRVLVVAKLGGLGLKVFVVCVG